MLASFDKKLGSWTCRTLIRGREVNVRIEAPANAAVGDLERQILAVTSRIETIWPEIEKRLITAGLTLFNEDWGPAGDLPTLSAEEFLEKVLLESVSVGENDDIEFFFNDSDLFAGHYVQFYCRCNGHITGPNLFG